MNDFDDFLEAKYPEIRAGINESVSEALKSLADNGIELDSEVVAISSAIAFNTTCEILKAYDSYVEKHKNQ
jgi:hypothetical protein